MIYQEPKPLGISKISAYNLAEHVAENLAFIPGENIVNVVTKLGGKIQYTEEELEKNPDSIVIENSGNFTIFISIFTSPLRDQFTIAHELGHYFFHYIIGLCSQGSMKATRLINTKYTDKKQAEVEANWFSFAFLMPENMFRNQWDINKGNVNKLSDFFQVSKSAINIRANDLKILQ